MQRTAADDSGQAMQLFLRLKFDMGGRHRFLPIDRDGQSTVKLGSFAEPVISLC